ncbi:MAG: DUF2141 domain-containing protein [Winogradskyella sp.]|uniref:DUF2141 domain-containing protein n=1 Tax=Winogradskyella sp. TaxID=1883156 RepID=UPI000F3E9155|nr:DUF2141 domain-containing protein [Winogradskyella sp.]RNC80231.1 MAG: DUF2141 domain-containing protein [Winogradskyella sp.]
MKNLIVSVCLVIVSFMSFAQEGVTITVTIDNVPNNEGVVALALHKESTFMKAAPIMAKTSKIEGNKVVITFEDVTAGEYAILGNHDANENGRMDFRENGMPIEAYGASNNVMNFGPPQFSDAKFIVKDSNISLNIRF